MEPKIISAATEPQRMLLFGRPKIGKTTSVSRLPRHLIIDTEVKGQEQGEQIGGTAYCHGARALVISNLNELREALQYVEQNRDAQDYVIIDTIDNIEKWVADSVCRSNGVNYIGDIPHGKGWFLVRSQVLAIIERFGMASKHLIVIGHQKDNYDEEEDLQVDKINLTGKLKTSLCAMMDATGHLYRDSGDNGPVLMVNFSASPYSDAGSRIPSLIGNSFELDWTTIYPSIL